MTTIPAPSRTAIPPPPASSQRLGEAVDRVRERARRTQLFTALLSAALAGTLFSSAAAQQITTPQAAFESLADSQWIRVKVPHVAGRYEGRLLQRGPDHLVLSADPEPLRIAATTIDTLWTRGNCGYHRRYCGWPWSLVRSAPLLARRLPGSVQRTTLQQERSCSVAVGIGLAGGALLGGLIGLATHKWHRQYP